MPKIACLLSLLLCCAVPQASAEIWKCAGKAGGAVYQNFPCHLDSIGSSASIAPPPATPSAAPAKTASAEPKPGMTQTEVRAIWGEPVEIFEDEQISGRFAVWRYAGNRTVQFNQKRRVQSVQR
jgi:hypothetical protein